MKISVFAPVKNEAQFIAYGILDCLSYVHEFVYACAESDDGTDELLDYIKEKHAGEKLKILRAPEFNFKPHDLEAYNNAFNVCIQKAEGEAVWFKHPDMICTNPEKVGEAKGSALAWWTNLTSYAGDYQTRIARGRAGRWKNIHAKKFGLHYYGAYGSQNEDMYFKDITGDAHVHYGESFRAYSYRVEDSGICVNHYCEMKDYKRRFEKMKLCLKTLYPKMGDERIEMLAANHPRVSLEDNGSDLMGHFKFVKTEDKLPEVFTKYKEEIDGVLAIKGGV